MSRNSKFINDVICAMAVELDNIQLQKLENVLNNNLYGKQITNECTELSTYSDDNDYILKVFAANKKLENLSEKSISQYVRTTRKLLLTLNKNYKDVTTNDIKYFLDMYQSRNKVSMTTLDNTLRFISTFFTWCTEEQYTSSNPASRIKNIKRVQKQKEYLADDEVARIKSACKTKRELAIVYFLLSVGCRVSELVSLNISDVDLLDCSLTIYGSKSKAFRTGYLNADAKLHLTNYIMSRDDDNEALFVASKGKHARLGVSSIQRELQVIARRAGINKHVTVHLFRKTFATKLSSSGVRIEVIKELLGHADISVTVNNYVTINKEDIRAAHRRSAA